MDDGLDPTTPQEVWDSLRLHSGFDYELAHITQPIPVATGVAALDKMLGGGIPVGTFTVIGGEGGAGKSALACLMAYNAAVRGRFPVFFSMEMPAQMVVSRMLSIHTKVHEDRLAPVFWSKTSGEVTRLMGIGERARMLSLDRSGQYQEAMRYRSQYGGSDVVLAAWSDFRDTVWRKMAVVDDVTDVYQACEWIEALCNVGIRPFPIIDYLQLGADDGSAGSTEYENVTKASHKLAHICKEHLMPMLVLSSLRNLNEKERDQTPQLSWYRGSGHVGYDAGTAIVLMRDGEPEPIITNGVQRGSRQRVTAHVIKNRVGSIGNPQTLLFNGARNLFGSNRLEND